MDAKFTLGLCLLFLVVVRASTIREEQTSEEVTSNPINVANNTCTQRAEINENPKYLVVNNVKKNWHGARNFCRRKGMALLEVMCEEQHNNVSRLLDPSKKYWLGTSALEDNTNFMWTIADTYLEFTAWKNGEPNDHGGNEKCVDMRFDEKTKSWAWNDVNCSSEFKNIVCQKVISPENDIMF